MKRRFTLNGKFILNRRFGRVLKIPLAALVVSGAVFYAACFPAKDRILEIRDADSGKVYGRWAPGKAGEFSIEFIHSVHQSPVRETFKIEGKTIRPLSVRFSSFGAGMPSDVEEGQTLGRDGDDVLLSGFNVVFAELNYIVGTVSDHLLYIKDETVSLRDLCGRNAHIVIRSRGE